MRQPRPKTNRYSMSRRRAALLVGITVPLATLAGCVDAGGSRAGGEPLPVALQIGIADPAGRPGSNQIDEFVRQVEERSDGRVRVEPVYQAVGEGTRDWDQEVARLVVSGELDLGMIPARAWDTEGVDTLRALQAPFLIQSEQHLAAVVADTDLDADLLAGLEELGVTGLALLPESLRRLFLFQGQEVTLATFEGATIRSPRSDTSWALFESLGATPTDAEVDDTTTGAESEVALAGTLPPTGAVVGNLTFFPKVNSLVVNSERFGDLTEEHQQVLRDAATATRDWAIEHLPDDQALARELCESGGRVIHADAGQLTAIRTAAAPVTDTLRRDDGTASLMDRIEAHAGSATPTEVAPCRSRAPEDLTSDQLEPDGGDLPDGTYRVEFTNEYLASQGLSSEMIGYNRGVWTIELQDGRWSVRQVAPGYEDTFGDIYQVVGRTVYWRFYEGEPLVRLRWSTTDQGDLRFEFVEGAEDARFHFGLPWRRVG